MVDVSHIRWNSIGIQQNHDENPRTRFMSELRSKGYDAPDAMPELDTFMRVRTAECIAKRKRPNEGSGWYWYTEVNDDYRQGAMIGIGVYGDFRLGNDAKTVWTSKSSNVMSPQEHTAYLERMKAGKIARDIAIDQERKAAKDKAIAIYNACPTATAHDYLTAKQIEPCGAKIDGKGRLIVPMYYKGEIASLQRIYPDGSKPYLKGGRTKGCYFVIGEDSDNVYVAEGFATAASIHMATGAKVYCAFNASNLMDVTNTAKDQNPESNVVICADDDAWIDVNVGQLKATAASEATQCRMVSPIFEDTETKPTDFNDLHCLEGLSEVKAQVEARPKFYETKRDYHDMPDDLLSPPGILGDVVNYYNASARAPQPGFAVQTALALASIVCSRNFQTSKNNHASLYFLNIAKSGTGKEHCKTVIEDILEASKADHLVNGSGYTSAGAVFSTLLRTPRHLTVIDEFGRYLEASNGQKNTNQMEANTILMEAIGRCHGTLRPTSYSTMTLTKDKADEMAGRRVQKPAITLVGMTTPVAFYNNITNNAVADGFLGRFIIHHSNMPRMVHDDKDMMDVPHKIVDWVQTIHDRAGYNLGLQDTSSETPNMVTLAFSGDCAAMLRDFHQETVDLANDLERFGLEALPGRSKEMAMRVALIVALAKNPHAKLIGPGSVKWAIDYVRFALLQTVGALKMRISGSDFEASKKEILEAIRESGERGVTWSEMQRKPPFSKFKGRDLGEIMDALIAGELVALDRVNAGKRGAPREAYVALA